MIEVWDANAPVFVNEKGPDGIVMDHGSSDLEINTTPVHKRKHGRGTILPLQTNRGMLMIKCSKRYVRSCATRENVWVEHSDHSDGPFSVVGEIHKPLGVIFEG